MKGETRLFIKELFTLALPIGFQSLINNLVNMIDSVMIGTLGEACISAVSVSGTFLWLANTFIMGLAGGASVVMAQDYGRGEIKRIKHLFSFVMLACVLCSVFFFVIVTLFPVQILKLYSNMPSMIEPGVSYLNIIRYSMVLNMLTLAIIFMLRSVRSVQLGLYNSIFSCVSNVFFNWVFIFGNLGAPAMGVAGAALGTLIARIIEMVVSIVYLFFMEKNLKFRLSDFNPILDMAVLKQYMQIAIPLLAIDVFTNFSSSVQTMITGRVNELYLSANSIVHNSWMLPSVFLGGASMAASVMIGNSIGRQNFEKAKRDSFRFIYASAIFGLFSGLMVQVICPILSTYYHVLPETLLLAKQMSYAATISVFFQSMAIILCNGVIKSGGMTNRIL
ncbi:MAG: MATE family efflux transporter [Erysipelotrichaceae bacterium]|nr:MATE family efflux transporter [Erysipelotrichaceae bacterium]